MRSTTKKRAERGFTLIEVMVALAIAGGALVLVLSANSASFRKSAEARLEERLQRAAESTFAQWRLGAERGSEGPLQGFDGHHWEVRFAKEPLGGLKGLYRVTFTVLAPGGKRLEWRTLEELGEESP